MLELHTGVHPHLRVHVHECMEAVTLLASPVFLVIAAFQNCRTGPLLWLKLSWTSNKVGNKKVRSRGLIGESDATLRC